ncbi:hypothetical protein LEP1GSC096_0080 [Leptospira interrogans serovar Hebdomadis str. R499]|uniref:hypothetical protein n=1 Tax=Leptospira TaxID=171 RepID=UPI0002985777|nr:MULTISPECIES: hypothetical protein [Leptospira]AJR16740.1 hypothetical protein LIL_50074 [Leptospira interrogans serovar Linhai str. 56609]EKR34399.1 hypothetical protein LEP1GSC096_0080 [Leptospira interrogans serovar Hebdomadis str. R499]EKR82556.1 hypothetical protein LEP1GSC099_1445 [Leptospira interrogans str. UI 08452]EMJ56544.1 hypothetical protein LEP1GSC111_1261 [Leptospira interrogans str. UT126]EMN33219.1 hypothetical protein LEP1GSC084_1072 [Leptospira interrogans serovar Medane
MIEIGKVVLFGKIWRHVNGHSLKIHYLIFEQKGPEDESGYAAVALELGLFSWGIDEIKSKSNLFQHIEEYLSSLKENEGLYELLKNTQLEEYWGIYRQLLFLCGDPETDKLRAVSKENEELKNSNSIVEEKFRESEERNSELKVSLSMLQGLYENLKKEKSSVDTQVAS